MIQTKDNFQTKTSKSGCFAFAPNSIPTVLYDFWAIRYFWVPGALPGDWCVVLCVCAIPTIQTFEQSKDDLVLYKSDHQN